MRATLLLAFAACTSSASAVTEPPDGATPGDDATTSDDGSVANLADRERLLTTYLRHLQAHPGAQENGLDGAQLTNICQLWSQLQPSAQSVFLTISSRLEGSIIAADSTTMLSRVTTLYLALGGENTTQTEVGKCGGSGNRLFIAVDATLHGALRTVFTTQGGPAGSRVIADTDPTSFWRNTHDLAGPHDPFTESNETEGGAPRGQLHYFKDPTSSVATSPIGAEVPDLATLVDPFLVEIDQDYDCFHASNPLCEYTLYKEGGCGLAPKKMGTDIYGERYGVVDLGWRPAGC